MRLSGLQKFIITNCGENKSFVKKEDFYSFYAKEELIKNKKVIQDAVHRCLENMVAKDILIAYGKKTAQKWFIEKVKLTIAGKNIFRELITSRQRKLPIK